MRPPSCLWTCPRIWRSTWSLTLSGAIAMLAGGTRAADEANYDESAVRSYTLPDVLAGPDGRPAE